MEDLFGFGFSEEIIKWDLIREISDLELDEKNEKQQDPSVQLLPRQDFMLYGSIPKVEQRMYSKCKECRTVFNPRDILLHKTCKDKGSLIPPKDLKKKVKSSSKKKSHSQPLPPPPLFKGPSCGVKKEILPNLNLKLPEVESTSPQRAEIKSDKPEKPMVIQMDTSVPVKEKERESHHGYSKDREKHRDRDKEKDKERDRDREKHDKHVDKVKKVEVKKDTDGKSDAKVDLSGLITVSPTNPTESHTGSPNSGSSSSSSSSSSSRNKKSRKSNKITKDFDPDVHCGVMEGSKGPCIRSITCSNHRIQLRKLVLGRSKCIHTLIAERKAAKEKDLLKHSSSSYTPQSEGKEIFCQNTSYVPTVTSNIANTLTDSNSSSNSSTSSSASSSSASSTSPPTFSYIPPPPPPPLPPLPPLPEDPYVALAPISPPNLIPEHPVTPITPVTLELPVATPDIPVPVSPVVPLPTILKRSESLLIPLPPIITKTSRHSRPITTSNTPSLLIKENSVPQTVVKKPVVKKLENDYTTVIQSIQKSQESAIGTVPVVYMPMSPVSVVSPVQFVKIGKNMICLEAPQSALTPPATQTVFITLPDQHQSNSVKIYRSHPKPVSIPTFGTRKVGGAIVLSKQRLESQRNDILLAINPKRKTPNNQFKTVSLLTPNSTPHRPNILKVKSLGKVNCKRPPTDKLITSDNKQIRVTPDVNGFILHADMSETAEAPQQNNSIQEKIALLNMK